MKSGPLRSLLLVSALAVFGVGCRSNSQPVVIEQPPAAEYGQTGEEIPMPPDQQGGGGRFGYSGNNSGGQAPPPAPRDVREMEAPVNAPAPPKPNKPVASTPAVFANPVSGNPLAVTLPGKHASLGQISIEKYDSAGNPTGEPLKRGTPVQIPDPNNPGQKIYFKVP